MTCDDPAHERLAAELAAAHQNAARLAVDYHRAVGDLGARIGALTMDLRAARKEADRWRRAARGQGEKSCRQCGAAYVLQPIEMGVGLFKNCGCEDGEGRDDA